MKALLYKDFLVATKYQRMFLLMDVFFVVIGIVGDVPFFLILPLAMSSALVSSLVSYDERAHFDRTCDMLPVGRRTQVLEKYLLGLLYVGPLFLLSSIGAARHFAPGTAERTLMLLAMLGAGLLPTALILPAVFRVGMEKARVFYYVFYFGGVGLSAFAGGAADEGVSALPAGLVPLAALVLLLLYALSCLLSVRFYEGREL